MSRHEFYIYHIHTGAQGGQERALNPWNWSHRGFGCHVDAGNQTQILHKSSKPWVISLTPCYQILRFWSVSTEGRKESNCLIEDFFFILTESRELNEWCWVLMGIGITCFSLCCNQIPHRKQLKYMAGYFGIQLPSTHPSQSRGVGLKLLLA